jgi:hypothetical protein
LAALSAEEVEELNQNATPPKPPARKKPAPKVKPKTVRGLPSKDADFVALDQAQTYQVDLGYRIASDKVGMALKPLDAPLTGKVTLTCKLQYANGDDANNGYLVFGDSEVESQLVKCGLRKKMGTSAIIQGPLADNQGATATCVTNYNEQYELSVTVDLDSGKISFQGAGTTVTAKLSQPMKSITHVGYCLNNTIVDVGPIEVAEAP